MAEVILENIQKHYGDRAVVHDLDLHIADKGFTVLVGPSGCGKSTTLRMVAGLETISGGRLLIDGRDVTHAPPQARDIAMVFQSYALYPHMSVHRNMAFGLLKTTSLAVGEIDRRVAEAADMLGISHLLQRKPNALSGGERQRVAIGRALVRQPKVFLFDEPLSNLDAKLRNKMRWELKRLHRELGLTVLYVTHDQIEAVTLGDRIAIMQGGRLQQVDAPMTVYRRPVNTFVASFIGAPEMNLLPCRMDRGSAVLCHPAFTLPLQQALDDVPATLAAQSLLLGLRPEEIRLVAGDAPATLRGAVRHVELVGADALVEVMAKDSPIMVRAPADAAPQAGDEVALAFDLHRLRLFDAATGRAVWGGGA